MSLREPVLLANSLTKVYRRGREEIRALDNVSFAIEHGQFAAITGPSGAGKTTLLNILGCMDTPTSGKIILLEITWPVRSMQRDGSGVVRTAFGHDQDVRANSIDLISHRVAVTVVKREQTEHGRHAERDTCRGDSGPQGAPRPLTP